MNCAVTFSALAVVNPAGPDLDLSKWVIHFTAGFRVRS
jgi:hypothetical protein